MVLESMLGNWPPADQMFLNDALEHWRVTATIPRPFRIHDRDRTPFANPETVRFGPEHATLLTQTELFETSLEKLPRNEATLLFATLRGGLVATKKDMATGDGDADGGGDIALRRRHARHTTRFVTGRRKRCYDVVGAGIGDVKGLDAG
jgi:hypothetical protein